MIRGTHNRSGFTLIELVMVVVLLAALLAITVPRYAAATSNYHVNMAAQKVAADLLRVRSEAFNQSLHHTVTFSTSSIQYTMTGVTDMNNKSNANTVVNLATSPYNVTAVSANFGGQASVTFDGYGMPNSGGQVTLTANGVQQTVTVDGTAGNITVP